MKKDPAPVPEAEDDAREEPRTRIVAAATQLLASGGREALTTRAVAAAASVQAPTLYRLFGDKQGLLDAVAEHGFALYLQQKKVRKPCQDLLDELRNGWDLHVGFGLENPAIYSIMYGEPRPGLKSSAAEAAEHVLEQLMQRLAAAGQLRVSERRAAELLHAAACGTVFSLLALAAPERDMGLSEAAREATIAAITSGAKAIHSPAPAAAAVALRAVLPDAPALTRGERLLLEELLERLANGRAV
jgi:AcrR family transcriptional regulator